jgi:hypothetical protein
MEYGVDLTVELPGQQSCEELGLVDVIDDFAINQIFEFVGARKIVDRNNLVCTALIERLDEI